jgi:hypothetical protein
VAITVIGHREAMPSLTTSLHRLTATVVTADINREATIISHTSSSRLTVTSRCTLMDRAKATVTQEPVLVMESTLGITIQCKYMKAMLGLVLRD